MTRIAFLLAPWIAVLMVGCAPAGSPNAALRGRVAVTAAALDLVGVGDVVWDVEVQNGAHEVVWQRRLSSSAFGDSAGSASYVGSCDAGANVAENTVRVWVVGVFDGDVATANLGTFAAGADSGPGTVNATPLPYESPTAVTPLARTVTCLPDADATVRFDVTLARPAEQGFFDVAITFNDVFCSAKYDCCDDATGDGCDINGTEDLLLLHDEDGARGRSHVLGFACAAGGDAAGTTQLLLSDLEIDCTDPYGAAFAANLTLDPSGAPGNQCTPLALSTCPAVTASGVDPDARLFQVAVYRGVEALTTGPAAATKLYWNVALGVRDLSGCRLRARGTADDASDPLDQLSGGVVAPGAVYPFVSWDVNLATCGSEPFGSASVATAYTGTETGGASFAHYSGAGGAGSFGPVEPPAPVLPLVLSPTVATAAFATPIAFIATGGTGGYTYSLVSGDGTVDPVTGVYTPPSSAASAVVRVTDGANTTADATVQTCADLTVTANTTLPSGAHCFGVLTVTNNAVLTLAGAAGAGGVTIDAWRVTVTPGAALSANGQGFPAGGGYGAGAPIGTSVAATSGGGHGGAGGGVGPSSCGTTAGGGAYGDPLAPATAGSGGATTGTATGGAGGGVVRLAVTDTLDLGATAGGAIRTNGTSGLLTTTVAGSGAGGSVWINAGHLTGAGTIAARGASATRTGWGCCAGAGAGGRVAVYATTNTSAVAFDVTGGATTDNCGPYNVGAAGSVVTGYAGVLSLADAAGTMTQAATWTRVVLPAGTALTVASGATLTASEVEVRGVLTNLGALAVTASLTLADGGRYVHDAAATLSATTAALSVASGTGYFDVAPTVPDPPVVASLTVPLGATLAHSANAATHTRSLLLEVLGDATVAGSLDVSARGFAGGAGPGKAANFAAQNAGGGGYGGAGGGGLVSGICNTGVVGGASYGDPLAPAGLGSGGGNAGVQAGGNGGGELGLTVGGTLTVTGVVRADGGPGVKPASNPGLASGAGSGGTIHIDAGALAGTGTITARGGAGVSNSQGCDAGAGGGGRIVVTAPLSTFTGSFDAGRGTGVGANSHGFDGTRAAAFAGGLDVWNFGLTVAGADTYTTLTLAANASAVIQAAGSLTIGALVCAGSLTNTGALTVADTWTLSGSARYVQGLDATLAASTAALTVPSGAVRWDIARATATLPQVASATIAAGAALTHSAHTNVHTYSLLLETVGDLTVYGAINVAAKGYASTYGPHPGATASSSPCGGGGGGYGGAGGPNKYCAPSSVGGGTGGVAAAPVEPGSGGGRGAAAGGAGGAGGGVVRLVAGGTLHLGGTVTANGGAGAVSGTAGGGGAGGSVWINAATLTGAGSVTATGGTASQNSGGYEAGAGGGGRVALIVTTNSSTVTRSAAGGSGMSAATNGVAGTLYP